MFLTVDLGRITSYPPSMYSMSIERGGNQVSITHDQPLGKLLQAVVPALVVSNAIG